MATKIRKNAALEHQIGTPVTLPINVSQLEKIEIILNELKGQPGEAVTIEKYLGPATGIERDADGHLKVAAGCTVNASGDIIVPDERKAGIQHPEYYINKK